MEMDIERKRWEGAARSASSLSELELTLGDLNDAVRDAEQSVNFAERSGRWHERLGTRSYLADALHQVGRRADALARHREAEKIQAESQPAYPLLYSVQGFRYCELLLAGPERAAWQAGATSAVTAGDGKNRQHTGAPSGLVQTCLGVKERAAKTLRWAEQDLGLLTLALDHLTLGCAGLYRTVLEWPDPPADLTGSALEEPAAEIEQAVNGLRRARHQPFMPRGLLTRAWLRALTGAPDGARRDLDEAWAIAERGPMPLHQADVQLHRARLFGDLAALAEARRLIDKHGYGRRREELEDAEARWGEGG